MPPPRSLSLQIPPHSAPLSSAPAPLGDGHPPAARADPPLTWAPCTSGFRSCPERPLCVAAVAGQPQEPESPIRQPDTELGLLGLSY